MGDQQAVELSPTGLDDLELEEDLEPPLNPVLMTLSTIGMFIGFVAFVAFCIPMWIMGSGH